MRAFSLIAVFFGFLILSPNLLSAAPIDFDTQVLPILTKAGCNAAACHGAAAGRGGFKLSLFAEDPAHDHRAIVFDLEGRRINYLHPENSLFFAKPTGNLDHGGDLRLDEESEEAALIATWIGEGARRLTLRRLVRLEVQPAEMVIDAETITNKRLVPLKVFAVFNQGAKEEVTGQSVFIADDPAAVKTGDPGGVQVLRGGKHNVAVRYLSKVTSVQITAPLGNRPVDLSKEPQGNWIDDEIYRLLSQLRLRPAPPEKSSRLLRRLRLDLTGRLPTLEEARSFPSPCSDAQWAKVVDQLLGSEEFTDYWTYQFAQLLRIRSQPRDKQGALTFHHWVRDQIRSGKPLSSTARSLLTAAGDTHVHGPANFYRVAQDARSQAEFFSEALMGVRLRCANCHNHPLDQWTQDDYHGLAAVFAPVETGQTITISTSRTVTHPKTGEAARPRIPGKRFLPSATDSRQALADWLTSPENPYFAKALVNRIWKALMGRGMIEPVDDIRATNPATHPRLLNQLADKFAKEGYDLRKLIRWIVTSAAYRRSAAQSGNGLVANQPASDPARQPETDGRFYRWSNAKPLSAEVLADALTEITGVAEKYGDQPLGARAVTLFDPRIPSRSLDILGRCSREDSCETSAQGQAGGLSKMLHLLNGPLLNDKISAADGRLAQLAKADQPPEKIVEEYYLRAFCRLPHDRERAYWRQQLSVADPDERKKRMEDFVWSLLNCKEFLMNH